MDKKSKEAKINGITDKRMWAIFIGVTLLMATVVTFPPPALTQDKPADNMQILREKVKADKKLLVAINMELTELKNIPLFYEKEPKKDEEQG